jgi:hypothetical protein
MRLTLKIPVIYEDVTIIFLSGLVHLNEKIIKATAFVKLGFAGLRSDSGLRVATPGGGGATDKLSVLLLPFLYLKTEAECSLGNVVL